MKKSIVRAVFFFGAAVLLLSGCSNNTLVATPTINWQPMPTYHNEFPTSATSKYTHYTPSAGFTFHLDFDYPSNWLLSEHINEVGWLSIFLKDPKFLTLPIQTQDPNYVYRPRHNYGIIDVWTFPSKPNQTADTELELLKRNYSQTNWMTLLGDYRITIDGYYATVLEYQMDDPENYTSLMFARRIFFVINGQFYEILYSVAEKDRGGEFDQGFDYFLSSLKFIP
ncbi:MAG: hypothetical protein HY867_20815 [Chloroflexi bacterium]|nr:hypothetical protein [Chloroflexota bacterium]